MNIFRVFIAFASILVSCLFVSFAKGSDLTAQFATVKLASGASISIPRAWKVLRGNELVAVETAVGASIDASGSAELMKGVELLIAARFPDPVFYAGVTVTSGSLPRMTPSFAESLSDAQVKAGEASMRSAIEATGDGEVRDWTPLRKQKVGENVCFVTSYVRSSEAGDRRVYFYKVFGQGRFYDLALSTSIRAENVNRIVLERIAGSFLLP